MSQWVSMAQRRYQTRPEDRERIDEFVEQKGGTPAWRAANTSLIEMVLGMSGKPLEDVTSTDVYKVRNLITDSQDYKQNYKRRLIYALREFFIWTGTVELKDGSAHKTIMKLPDRVIKTKSKRDMLTTADVQQAIDACTNVRDKCWISMAWDSSCRPSELLKLDWDDLIADEYGFYFDTEDDTRKSKTGRNRHIRLTTSQPYIEAYRQQYPGNATGKNPVFATIRAIGGKYRRWDITALQEMIRLLREKTGIKNLKPYQFRPSRITHDLRNHADMAFVMLKNWGSLDSEMAETYAHLDEDEEYLDQQALRAAGIKTRQKIKEQSPDMLEVPVCPKCGTMNVSGARFCSHCRAALTEQARQRIAVIENSMEAEVTEQDFIDAAKKMYAERKKVK